MLEEAGAEHKRLQAEVSILKEQLKRSCMQSETNVPDESNETEILLLWASVESLQQEVSATQTELESNLQREYDSNPRTRDGITEYHHCQRHSLMR